MMDAKRFQVLADAYGGDIARWPTGEQADARAFMADDRRATAWLSEGAALDALLDGAATQTPSDLLRMRVIRSAPKPDAGLSRPAAWASWAGLAAACAAGVIFGVSLSANANIASDPITEANVQASTAFADSPLSQPIGDNG